MKLKFHEVKQELPMAEEEKLQVNVDFTKYPELYQALDKLVEELDTDRSKLIRQLVRERLDLHEHVEHNIGARVKSKIKQVARS
jgi:metal-responsive CopG/Arc/MetJ family transcriptional regulator